MRRACYGLAALGVFAPFGVGIPGGAAVWRGSPTNSAAALFPSLVGTEQAR
jgi:hypothetical protein